MLSKLYREVKFPSGMSAYRRRISSQQSLLSSLEGIVADNEARAKVKTDAAAQGAVAARSFRGLRH